MIQSNVSEDTNLHVAFPLKTLFNGVKRITRYLLWQSYATHKYNEWIICRVLNTKGGGLYRNYWRFKGLHFFLTTLKEQLRIVLSRSINAAQYHYRSNRQHASKINSRSFLNLCVCQLDGRPLQSVASGAPPFGEDISFLHTPVFLLCPLCEMDFSKTAF